MCSAGKKCRLFGWFCREIVRKGDFDAGGLGANCERGGNEVILVKDS